MTQPLRVTLKMLPIKQLSLKPIVNNIGRGPCAVKLTAIHAPPQVIRYGWIAW
jgi:hypothetical protein